MAAVPTGSFFGAAVLDGTDGGVVVAAPAAGDDGVFDEEHPASRARIASTDAMRMIPPGK
jgi:hypothetical protein